MDIITWLIVGGLIGWLASRVMRPDAQQPGFALNIVIGIAGAFLGGWFVSPFLRAIAALHQSNFSAPSVFVSVLGAIILLAAASFLARLGAH
jgi:uncharacterized membrane protein YeaQ/YmgE (transglycosylase-associated protein family)